MAKRNKIKIRRTWGTLKPVTRVKQSKRIYRRTRINRDTDYGSTPGACRF